uniref:KIB1-4 beta-propeller domain-containing protein n=1 Tax=Arundo donax TaxID=35708 RepID=A0A0A9AYE0_ARUDO
MRKRTRFTLTDPLRSSCGDRLLRICGQEEWRDWRNLPSELTEEIATRLLRYDVAEYLRLRAACKAWRECTGYSSGLDSRFRPRRWIMLSSCDGARCRFLNLGTGACAQVDLPELSGHRIESSTEGLLVLREKASDAIRLLNPLTRAITDLPPITAALRSVSPDWSEDWKTAYPSRIVYAGISDETSPPTVALFMRGQLWNIAYAKPGDERWALVDDKGWRTFPNQRVIRDGKALRYVWYLSAVTLRGRIYFATFQGNILKLRLHPRPRLVPLVKDQSHHMIWHCDMLYHNVVSYLVPADDNHSSMLMVRHYSGLDHLSPDEQRRMKRRKKTSLIKLPGDRPGRYNWHQLEVCKVDLAGKRLVPVESIGHRAVFVGDVACISLSAQRFPSVYGNVVYLGMNSHCSIACGLCHLQDNRIEPRLEHVIEGGGKAPLGLGPTLREPERIVPLARPCSLEEYLVCRVGFKKGIKD